MGESNPEREASAKKVRDAMATIRRRAMRAVLLMQLGEQILIDLASENPTVKTEEWVQTMDNVRKCIVDLTGAIGTDGTRISPYMN